MKYFAAGLVTTVILGATFFTGMIAGYAIGGYKDQKKELEEIDDYETEYFPDFLK